MINILLIIGGLYLCYEGAEKLVHKFLHSAKELEDQRAANLRALADPKIDIKNLEKVKIKGAIRTDFVLSAEIIVIILGTVQTVSFITQVTILSILAVAFTVAVYGFVALIVKLDDIGLYLLRKSVSGRFNSFQRSSGRALLIFAPILMKLLSIVGTAAMFLVGGGIIVHGTPFLHHFVEHYIHIAETLPNLSSIASSLTGMLLNAGAGILSGFLVLVCLLGFGKLKTFIRDKE
jgi:hypothetical protein